MGRRGGERREEGGGGVSSIATSSSDCMVKHCEEQFCATTLKMKGNIYRLWNTKCDKNKLFV